VSDKTEEPTPRRLRRAQDEGDSPVSAFASQAVAFVCAVALAPTALAALATRASADLRAALARAAEPSPALAFEPLPFALSLLALTAPVLLAAAVASAVTSLLQSGGVVAPRRLRPRLEALSVLAGLRRLGSGARATAALRAALFGAGAAFLAYAALREHAGDLARSAGRVPEAAAVTGALAIELAKRAALLGLFLAVLDVVLARRAWRRRLKMTPREVKRERKETDGDPELTAARARARDELIAAASVASVEQARVVVVDHGRIACALRYDEGAGDEAPVLLAVGRGVEAARVTSAALARGVAVIEEAALARALGELEVGAAIPEALYEPVATLLRDAHGDEGPPEAP
jgi:flagellar biosynthesis protein FlhB